MLLKIHSKESYMLLKNHTWLLKIHSKDKHVTKELYMLLKIHSRESYMYNEIIIQVKLVIILNYTKRFMQKEKKFQRMQRTKIVLETTQDY